MRKSEIEWLHYEFHAASRGYKATCGVDEAGRGPLAGPVYAAAVILKPGCIIKGINDSKKLTAKRREELFDVIKSEVLSYSIASASVKEIDELNILQATFLAMERAVEGLDVTPDFALIDGNRIPPIVTDAMYIVKGDSQSMSIAAASILAKVSRDRYMLEMAEKYPEYQFEKHKGYGTKLHYEMLDKYGPCEIHRQTFLRTWYEKENNE
ncbi:MAG: ribonuclease HII [Eubacterium sp.]|nr:ribonuclease HII [Eubacterium sp.]